MDYFWTLLILLFIGIYYFDIPKLFIAYSKWLRGGKSNSNYCDDKLTRWLFDFGEKYFFLSGSKLPYGRAKWFIQCDEELMRHTDLDYVEFYGYTPVRSNTELEFCEYGVLLTQDGLLTRTQADNRQQKRNKKIEVNESMLIPFAGLWLVKYNKRADTIVFYYGITNRKVLDKNNEIFKDIDILKYIEQLNSLIDTGYTRDLHTRYIEKNLKKEYEKMDNINVSETAGMAGAIAGVNANIENHFEGIQLNRMVGSAGRHGGFSAEYANDLMDKIKHPFQNVEQVGQANIKDGADRVVGNQQIQTKYFYKAKFSVNGAFRSNPDGGEYRYPGMQLEVPKDQYLEAIELFKQKIIDGKVPNCTDPEAAYNIVRRGNVTYNEAKLIAMGGNITSIKYDVIDGAVHTLPIAGISFIITFAQSKWSGCTTEEAVYVAMRTGAKSLVAGTAIIAGSQQFAKLFTKQMGEKLGVTLVAQNVAKRASLVISIGIVIVPNIFDSLAGRISKQQLLKNSLIAGAGIGGGALAGAALGSLAPGPGNVAGAIAGGFLGTKAGKKVLDYFIEDDRVEMFAILKEEYIDVVMSMFLTEDEFTKVQELIFDKKLESKLKQIYKEGKKKGFRSYAREDIIEVAVISVIEKRDLISDNTITDGINQINSM